MTQQSEDTVLRGPAITPAGPKAMLAARARGRASLEDLLAECDLAQEKALERVRVGKHGDEVSDPDLHAYLKATELKAKLLGLLRNQPDDGAGIAEQVWPKAGKEKRS